MPPQEPDNKLVRRGRRTWLWATILGVFMCGAMAAPFTASAILGVGDTSVTVGDIPRTIAGTVERAFNRVKAALKVAADIAFKNTLEKYNARIAQEVLTQVATAGPGQKPLFLTNPKTFFRNVADSAAGDFIDEFTRGLTNQSGPGAPTSTARQRFLISRVLRTAVGSPIEQCRESCRRNFSVNLVSVSGGDIVPAQQNAHEQLVQLIYNHISGADQSPGTRALAELNPTEDMVCRDVAQAQGPLLPGQTYLPWRIAVGACGPGDPGLGGPPCQTAAQTCLLHQNEAIREQRAEAQFQTNQCLKDCQTGSAAFAQGLVTDLTATDIFTAVGQLDAATASRRVAEGLSSDKSDFGQLLGAMALLGVRVQDRVTGEETTIQSGQLPRTSKVSEVVLVPKEAGQQSLLTALTGGDDAKKIYTGSSAADIIKGVAAFLNSPLGKMLGNFFKDKCGLNPDVCRGPSQPSSALGQLLFGSGGATGLAGAKLQFASFGRVNFITGDPGRNEVSVVDELAAAGLIDAQFRNAIEDERTVQEALDRGLLDPQKTFGFDKSGVQPREGYPYRSLQYLRKYRVTPVGWELAALYSQQFDPRDLSLGFLTNQANRCAQDDDHKVCSSSLEACVSDGDCGSGETCGASPYCGLVDPNWVLKAPQTFCRRQGAGEEIITKEFVCDENNVDRHSGDPIPPGTVCSKPNPGETVPPPCTDTDPPNCNPNVPKHDIGRWIVNRNPNTCADVQSCIAENENGTCIAYGYCVQERQTFKFDGERCDAQFASCTAYTDSAGQRASYLATTLDSRFCNSDSAGCQWYCAAFDSGSGKWLCGEPKTDDNPAGINEIMRFANAVKSCSPGQAGCRQFLRTANGSNLLPNGGFEIFSGADLDGGGVAAYPGWTGSGSPVTATDSGVSGSNLAAVSLSGSLSATVETGWPLDERTLIGSIRARATGSCSVTLSLGVVGGATATAPAAVTSDWNSYFVTLSLASGSPPSTSVEMTINGSACSGSGLIVDSAQLEEGSATQYKDYGAVNTLHMNGNRRACLANEVGCEAYRPAAGGQTVTGLVRNSNRCSEDHVGCATFNLEEIAGPLFRPGGPVNIVPDRAQSCSAAAVGCEEYTNLDEVAAGGEGREFYKSVKQCMKPDPTNTDQVNYYTWVGDAKQGFILRAHTLLRSNIQLADEFGFGPCTNVQPVTLAGAVPICNDTAATAARCSQADLATNPDCAEYYDAALNVYYRLRSRTVSVTNACHPYRNTIDQTDADSSNDDNIYFLSPSENVSCSATAAGCREYTGNSGHNTRVVLNDNFESGTTSQWVGGISSSESISLGGRSMLIDPGAGNSVAYTQASVLQDQLVSGRQYIVTFLAGASQSDGGTIGAAFGSVSGVAFDAAQTFGSGNLKWNATANPPGPQWEQYAFGPVTLQDRTYRFGLTVTGGAFVDNVALTEITSSLYLISDSVPFCPASEIGCAAYRDRAGQPHYLKSFSKICSEAVVGCEAMIDTQNSSTPFAQTVKNELTPADQVVTIVNNRATYCSAASKGCQAFGAPVYSTDQTLNDFKTVHLINDPDTHARDLCLQQELFCRAYTTAGGTAAFFKDPGTGWCEFKTDSTESGGAWYIADTPYRCPVVTPPVEGRPVGMGCAQVCNLGQRAGKACVSSSDCPGGACVGDPVRVGKYRDDSGQFVYGRCTVNPADGTDNCGDRNPGTPDNRCVYLAGRCPDAQNGCNEYRDPTDPPGCRSECPLILQGGSPIYLDTQCQPARCDGSSPPDRIGQNCRDNSECGGGVCADGNNNSISGIPGCRSYFYLRQTVETNAADCNGQIDFEIGCRAFNDVSRPTLNFRGE